MNRCFRAVSLAFVFTFAVASAAAAQDVADLMRRFEAARRQGLAAIDNMTVTQDMMGQEAVTYMEKREVDGVPQLLPVSMTLGGRMVPIPGSDQLPQNEGLLRTEWANRFELAGEETVEGHRVLVLLLEDPSVLPRVRQKMNDEVMATTTIKAMRFYIDPETLLMWMMKTTAEVVGPDGAQSEVTSTMKIEEYREVSGYQLPWRTRLQTAGLPGMEADSVAARMEQMKSMLDRMPPERRAMMEKVVDQLQAQLDQSESGGMLMEVKDVKVNAGPPTG